MTNPTALGEVTHMLDGLLLNGSMPTAFRVFRSNPPEDKTALYGVVADYGWAETPLCAGGFLHQANAIAAALHEVAGVPVTYGE